jgi:hypothetical protein
MVRTIACCVLFVLFAAPVGAAPAPAQDGEKKPLPPEIEVWNKLSQRINFPGFERDEKMTFKDALEAMSELYGITFHVDEAAFRAAGIEDVFGFTPVEKQTLAKMFNVPLKDLLGRCLLARLPAASGATYVVRSGFVEITTGAAVRAEFLRDDKRDLLPLVHADYDRLFLGDALRDLADRADWNIVLDARAAKRAKVPVTARLRNVPLDTAVRLLADMAGLKSVQTDNVIYVTTPENARAVAPAR